VTSSGSEGSRGAAPSWLGSIATILLRDLRALGREVEGYPDDASPWTAVPGATNLGGTLVLHLCGNLEHFIGARLGGTGYRRDRDAEFSTRGLSRAALLERIAAAEATVREVLPSLSDATMRADYPDVIGGMRLTTGDFLTHLAAHLGYHLGQLDYHRRFVTSRAVAIGAMAIPELASARIPSPHNSSA